MLLSLIELEQFTSNNFACPLPYKERWILKQSERRRSGYFYLKSSLFTVIRKIGKLLQATIKLNNPNLN